MLTVPSSSGDSESQVLVIYTGGTIGMLLGQQGYQPEPFYLTSTLRSQSRFHDPLGDSLLSNSSSVEGYREWSTSSSRGSPSSSPKSSTLALDKQPPHSYSGLLVRSSRPILAPPDILGMQPKRLAARLRSVKTDENCHEMLLPSLVTPKTGTGKRIRYVVLEWQPLLDSSNVEIDDWVRIATDIELNYHFDAFVILHGTDTMCYSSSALSFLLEDLGKTVIITGAQIPLSQLRNDAVENLLGALTIAGNYIIPECSLYFNHTLYRGNRVSKMSSLDLNAFNSPNFPPLVNVGINIHVNWNDILRQKSLKRFRVHKAMCPNVATLRLFPGITGATIKAFLAPPIQGVVLETYGSGNAPQRKDLMDAFKAASDRGVVIVNITQCTKGSVSDAYATGRALANVGVIPGADMTPECALAKLSYLLSKPELSTSQVRELVRTPLRGELTLPAILVNPVSESLDAVQDLVSEILRMSSPQGATISRAKPPSESLNRKALNTTASWPSTASDAVSAEAALLPLLIHLAVSNDDTDGVKFCIEVGDRDNVGGRPPSSQNAAVARAGGIVNSLDYSSGRSPIHVAALNGCERCADLLLTSGALVHLRDSLDHTALYYAARQGHERIVHLLVKAGASFSGADIAGGYVEHAVAKAKAAGDTNSLRLWTLAGADLGEMP
ncbi:hypothetical protein BOTBODRAFT_70609 [Botryobasidium botryosum FD-172 SS1]|uniref:asparaginase n=1 Tax=Botryobasidium botryosum (strain FD-172 SS1) TaxID=930990 RepID=A0A067M5A2_BOTB1|nr:hypothetical protein BOTBODRAFT_70609 [Botryobasidium botryosum FD-172 SS1]